MENIKHLLKEADRRHERLRKSGLIKAKQIDPLLLLICKYAYQCAMRGQPDKIPIHYQIWDGGEFRLK